MPDDDQLIDEENTDTASPSDDDAQSDESGHDHEIPEARSTKDDYHHDQFHDPIAPPSVTGEEDVFSGDATEGEAADIDDELAKVGLENDEGGAKPLSSDDIDY